jgi:hypothetical protein
MWWVKFFAILLMALAVFPRPARGETVLNSSVSLEEEQYADETSPASRIDIGAEIHSEDTLEDAPLVPVNQARLYSFYESGAGGDYSLDVDSTALRVPLSSDAHLWFGRVQPLSEGYNHTELTSTDAIGANWVQNQSDALTPRVSGWIGTGVHFRTDSGFTFTAAYSPIFLPSFGPRVDYSSSDDSSGSRFARLPPQCVVINGQCIPLRYQIDVGQLSSILLQNQGTASVGYETKVIDAHAMFWSAPNPNPGTNTQGQLRFQQNNGVNVLVTADPYFERQDFAGFDVSLLAMPGLVVVPSIAGAIETQNGQVTLSAKLNIYRNFKLGYLTSFNNPPSDSPVVTPLYPDRLVWAEYDADPILGRITPSMRVEQHIIPGAEDHWIHPKVDFLVDRKTTLFASASILEGTDNSYFGTWRALSSVAFGGRYQW